MSNGFHKISYQNAKNYILRFVNQDDLYSVASSMALGGTIKKEVFEDSFQDEYPGSIAWYCFNYNNSEPEHPSFFVAIETTGVTYNTDSDPPDKPVNPTLKFTKDVFTYTMEATMECVEFFLDH
ncbi:MAG TPA: hypothetical protein VJY62_07570, partial [Bacteroidia bacterium]|nr:hypothetical protein [Bacteroidia bacterium]